MTPESTTITTPFQPTTELERHVHAGDREAVLALLRPLDDAARRAHRASARRMFDLWVEAYRWGHAKKYGAWGGPATEAQSRALGVALLLCGTGEDLAHDLWLKDDDLVALIAEFRPTVLDGLAEALIAHSPGRINAVQALVGAGLVPRPVHENYVVGMMQLTTVGVCRNRRMADYFAQDPGLRRELIRVLDVVGTADVSLAGVDKYSRHESWTDLLCSAAADGVIPRADLLDRTLSALERDEPQFRAGWYARFHGALAPTAAEMRAHAARYLHLLASRIPPTVSVALDAMDSLAAEDAVTPAETVDALAPVLAGGNKGQIDLALKLCDRAVARDPALRDTTAALACTALVHEAPDVQKKVLQRLKAWGLDDASRGRLREALPGLAASNRATAEALAGEPASASLVACIAAPAPVPAARMSALDPTRALPPFAADDVDGLVAAIAHTLENDEDLDAFERVVEALVRLSPPAPPLRAALAPVARRASKVRTPVAAELARLLLSVLGESVPRTARAEYTAQGLLADRIDSLVAQACMGWGLPPLASPTHRAGFIDPATLAARLAAYEPLDVLPDACEQQLALLRLAPPEAPDALAAARRLAPSPVSLALRRALGDDVTPRGDAHLLAAASRIRHPGADDPDLAPLHEDAGPDAARVARYAWSVETSSHTVDGRTYHHHYMLVSVTPPRPRDTTSIAAARHLFVAPDMDPRRAHSRAFGGEHAALVRYGATLLPSDLSAFFAEGAWTMAENLDWSDARWHVRAYLEPLLDPVVDPGPMGTLMLLVTLADREAGLVALAVDAFVATLTQGRMDRAAMCDTFRALMATPLLKPTRLRKSLEAALRLAPQLAPEVIDLLWAGVAGCAEEPPRDLASLLELLHELLVAGAAPATQAQRAPLAAMTLGGKGRTLQKAILALPVGTDSA